MINFINKKILGKGKHDQGVGDLSPFSAINNSNIVINLNF